MFSPTGRDTTDWIGCGSEQILIVDWVRKLVDCVGLDLAEWTHVQHLCNVL